MSQDMKEFVERYADALNLGNASIFVGAGISKGSGYVDWTELFSEIAANLGLDISLESDYLALAEYYIQAQGNKTPLIDHVLRKLNLPSKGNKIHQILTETRINNIWTTNYDHLIEDTYRANGIICEVKKTDSDLTQLNIRHSINIYKMHGDVDNPYNIVISKSDYENYETNYFFMSNKLINELAEKTFLFIGFGMSDPNFMKHISKIKCKSNGKVRTHYSIMIEPVDNYEKKKFYLFIKDLQHYGIQTIVIQNYSELVTILEAIKNVCPGTPNILTGQSSRDAFMVNKLSELNALEEPLEIFICSVFSSFAISDSSEYFNYEPLNDEMHKSNQLLEKELLCQLASKPNVNIKLLVCPPYSYQAHYSIRYKNLNLWLESNKSSQTIEVKCSSIEYFRNVLIVKNKFCIVADYTEGLGYDENRVYYDANNINYFIKVFNDRFSKPKFASNIAAVIERFNYIIATSEKNNNYEWEILKHKEVFNWHIYKIFSDMVKNDEYHEFNYSYLDHPGSVIIIPIIKETNELILTKQYRYLQKKLTLEFPCGAIIEGERPEEAALRELREEIGYETGMIRILGHFFPSNAYSNEKIYVAIAENLTLSHCKYYGDEKTILENVKMSFQELKKNISENIIDDGATICATMMFAELFYGK